MEQVLTGDPIGAKEAQASGKTARKLFRINTLKTRIYHNGKLVFLHVEQSKNQKSSNP